MKFSKRFAITSMAVSLALVLGACGDDDAAEKTTTEETEQPATENTETTKT